MFFSLSRIVADPADDPEAVLVEEEPPQDQGFEDEEEGYDPTAEEYLQEHANYEDF